MGGFGTKLAEGLIEAAGGPGAARVRQLDTDRRATAHEELQAKTQSILDDVALLQQRRMKLDPSSPSYQKDVAEIDTGLHQARQAFTDLYHPTRNPGNLQHFMGFLRSHLGRNKTQAPPATPAEARGRFDLAQLDATAAGGGQAPVNQYKQQYDELRAAGFSDEEARNKILGTKPAAENWVYTDVILGDGRQITVQHNTKTNEILDLAGNPMPKEMLAGARQAPKSTSKPVRAWTKRNGQITSVLIDPATNKVIAGSENPDIVPPASMQGKVTTGFYHYVDDKGLVHQIEETRTTMPAGGGSSTSAPPKTPKEAKSRIKPPVESKDKTIGFKGSKDYNDTKASYEAAVDRTDTMDKNLVNALAGDQQAMLSLVANHIGMTLGAQKGARINRAVWDEAVQSAPWMQRIAAKFDDRGYLSGVTLAPDQMRQMVRLAHEKVDTLKKHLDRLKSEAGVSDQPSKGKGTQDDPIVLP